MGALRAVEMLNGPSYKNIFYSKILPNPEVIIAYKIYFQLFNNESLLKIDDNQKFFEKVCDYFIQNDEKKIGKKFFNFSKITLIIFY